MEAGVVHRAERRVVERVEAHRDAPEAGVRERLGLGCEQRAVGRQCQVDPKCGEHRDQALDVAPHERLAAGDPQFRHPEIDRGAGDALDLLEAEQLAAGEERVVAAEDVPWACSRRSGSCNGR